jgi:putative phosphoribosyl transferase
MSREAFDALSAVADSVECVAVPDPFGSVGAFYEDFSQTSDEEVRSLLARAGDSPEDQPRAAAVRIPCRLVTLDGDLKLPPQPRGLIVFAHGSGSSRLSKRNQQVAASLNERGFATLLFDLLSENEEALDRETMELRFNIRFLADRLVQVTDWLLDHPATQPLEIGYFGASTGAAAALVAAAKRPDVVKAVVSRGGRPDLAAAALPHVAAATLLIVGGNDTEVLALNRGAAEQLRARDVRLTVVPGATHLFEEPGALEQVARLAGEWFEAHVGIRAVAGAAT